MDNNYVGFRCGICKKIYDTIEERTNCELECIKKFKEEEKRAAHAKLEAEKDERFSEASAALDNAYAIVSKCVEDYGNFVYQGKYKGLDLLNMDFFPSKLWHHFWF